MCHFDLSALSYSRINYRKEKYPEEAGKVTGMLLEMDKEDLVPLVNERDALESKADEAVAVLEEHRAGQSTDE